MLEVAKLIDRAFTWILFKLCIILFFVMIAAVFGQVVMRYAFSSPLSWSDELARYAMVWLAMLACALCSRQSQHITLMGVEFGSPQFVRFLRIGSAVLVCAILALLVWISWDLASRATRQTTPGLGLSMAWVYACLPIGFALMILGQILGLLTASETGGEQQAPLATN